LADKAAKEKEKYPNRHEIIGRRPQDNHVVLDWYGKIIDSYRIRLDVEYKQTGHFNEQSLYNQSDSTSTELSIKYAAKDFRGYVRRGIRKGCFPNWLTEDGDIEDLSVFATTHEFHNISWKVLRSEIQDYYFKHYGKLDEDVALLNLAELVCRSIEDVANHDWEDDSNASEPSYAESYLSDWSSSDDGESLLSVAYSSDGR
jgi:hypothetical protein